MSLFDIAPARETVTVGGVELPVPGISIADLVALLSRFPALQALLGGGTDGKPLAATDLLTAIPEAASAIMAAGLGYYGNKEAEERVGKLPFGDQLRIMEKVVEASLPDGVDPTAARLNKMAALLSGEAPAKGRARK